MLAATIEELRAIALGATDASGYFPAMYAQVTDRIRAAAASGRFDDAARMERFAETFAGFYTRARAGTGDVPRCWQGAFDVAGDGRLMIVQHLLLGINAHVNNDLPQVVVALAGDADLAPLKPDFDAVNTILAETLPMVLHSLGTVSRWVNVVAARGGQRVFDFSLVVARDQAWRAAERLHGLDATARPAAVHELDDMVAVLAYLVAHPGPPGSWAAAVGRRLELHDPVKVTRALLGPLA
ncbi:MAG: hypothetical protein RJA49_28 [Actinomycetota bacterium]